jgi:hypothetical protein
MGGKQVMAGSGVRAVGSEDELVERAGGFAPGERRFWRWLALGLGAVAMGKGMHLPGPWPYTQAQLNYSLGFMRRGLFGSVFGQLLGLNRYAHFAIFSTVLLFLLYGLLVLLVRVCRLGRLTPPGDILGVFASSYSVTYLAHLNGYLDIPLAMLCAAPLFVRSVRWRAAAAIAATVVGILIHEQFFFAFVALLTVSVVFGAASDSMSERRFAWAGAIVLVVVAAGLTWYLGRHATISAAQTQQLEQAVSARVDAPLTHDVFDVLPRTAGENLEIMRSVWRRRTFLPAQVESLLMFGPTAAVLLWATFLLLREWQPQRYRWLFAGVLLATLAPLSLHLVGWDKNRWNELLSLNAFLMLLLVARLFGAQPVRLPVRVRRAFLVVMLLNMATGGGLMGNLHIRPFPFLRNPDPAAEMIVR